MKTNSGRPTLKSRARLAFLQQTAAPLCAVPSRRPKKSRAILPFGPISTRALAGLRPTLAHHASTPAQALPMLSP